jgi:hypothetical protein
MAREMQGAVEGRERRCDSRANRRAYATRCTATELSQMGSKWRASEWPVSACRRGEVDTGPDGPASTLAA